MAPAFNSPAQDFSGQTVIVTGAAGALGSAYCRALAARGATVVINDVDEAAVAVLAEELADRGIPCTASVADAAGGREIVLRATAETGRLDAVIINAGVWRNAPYEEMTAERVQPVLDVHLAGAFNVTQPAWSELPRGGRIVLTSSGAGVFGRPAGANYCAAKAAMLGLMRSLALEGAERGIRVNCLLPVADAKRERAATAAGAASRSQVRALFDALGAERSAVDHVVPMLLVLAGSGCPVSGEAYSACGGRYARLVLGLTPGWLNPSTTPVSPEALRSRIVDMAAADVATTPSSVYDEIAGVVKEVEAASGARGESPDPRG